MTWSMKIGCIDKIVDLYKPTSIDRKEKKTFSASQMQIFETDTIHQWHTRDWLCYSYLKERKNHSCHFKFLYYLHNYIICVHGSARPSSLFQTVVYTSTRSITDIHKTFFLLFLLVFSFLNSVELDYILFKVYVICLRLVYFLTKWL